MPRPAGWLASGGESALANALHHCPTRRSIELGKVGEGSLCAGHDGLCVVGTYWRSGASAHRLEVGGGGVILQLFLPPCNAADVDPTWETGQMTAQSAELLYAPR